MVEKRVHGESKIEVQQTRIWRNSFILVLLHSFGTLGFGQLVTGQWMWQTIFFTFVTHYLGLFGITGGTHRYWSHQSFKAKFPLKLLFVIAQTVSGQESVIIWTRNHRLHHKCSETDGDPYNSKRGFFFSHIGWLISPKHESVMTKLKTTDISDLEADPVLMFQHKYYDFLAYPIILVLLPGIPWLLWDESLYFAFAASMFRYMWTLHCVCFVNSVAHMWGYKPYDKSISPVENKWVTFFVIGEGFHNYHHVFPWDYKTSELGNHYYLNMTKLLIDFFAWIGWAYDLKTVSPSLIEARSKRTGDGSRQYFNFNHDHHHDHHENTSWGWGDKDDLLKKEYAQTIK